MKPPLLARKRGPELLLVVLMAHGDLCPDCLIGTKVVSKKQARCPVCGRKVARKKYGSVPIKGGLK